MAKPPGPGLCVHCLEYHSERTWDHVFPKGWYPESTPLNIAKWQIPSCARCNQEYGKLEDDLLVRLGLVLDPEDERSGGIVGKALRAVDPRFGEGDKDKSRRQARKDKIRGELLVGDGIPDQGLYPGLDRTWGQQRHELEAITISAGSIRRLTEKIVRGIFYMEDGRFIEPPYRIEFFALSDSAAAPVREVLDRFGTEYARAPGIVVRRAVTPEDNMSSIFEINIWGQFKMFASVLERADTTDLRE